MPSYQIGLLSVVVFLALQNGSAQALTYTNQFRDWYPQYGWIFRDIVHTNCTTEYNNYLTGNKNHSQIHWTEGGGIFSALTEPVVECILSNVSEYIKAQISSSQVLLGVGPTIFALIGPSTDETATFLIAARRPLLFLLIACGSPSVYFSRAFDYPDPAGLLKHHRLRLKQPDHLDRLPRSAVTVLEYALVLASVANIAFVNYELGVRTICVIMSDWILAPMFWGFLGIFVHILAAITMRLRLRRLERDEQPDSDLGVSEKSPEANKEPSDDEESVAEDIRFSVWLKRVPRLLQSWAVCEFRISSSQSDVRIDVFRESKRYIFLAWVLSTVTICHILFGTLIFANTIFIGPQDALTVVARYMASVMACRVVLMYELAGLRDTVQRTKEGKDKGNKDKDSKEMDAKTASKVKHGGVV